MPGEGNARVADGRPEPAVDGLTDRQRQVLLLVGRGLTDVQIAGELHVSPRTIHAHLRAIYRKLNVSRRSGATRYAVQHGLV